MALHIKIDAPAFVLYYQDGRHLNLSQYLFYRRYGASSSEFSPYLTRNDEPVGTGNDPNPDLGEPYGYLDYKIRIVFCLGVLSSRVVHGPGAPFCIHTCMGLVSQPASHSGPPSSQPTVLWALGLSPRLAFKEKPTICFTIWLVGGWLVKSLLSYAGGGFHKDGASTP